MGSIKREKFDVLLRPRITEKAAVAGSSGNCIVFEVHPDANKREIKGAVEKVFDVKVKHVRTANSMGKVKKLGVHQGRRKSVKKAYVYLEKGSSINVVDGL